MGEQPRARTLVEIGRLAGKSPATVSRALAGSPLVSDLTRRRIQSLAEQHHFQPNPMARNLRARAARTFAGVIADTTDQADGAMVLRLLGRISGLLHARGYTLNLCPLQAFAGDAGPVAHVSQVCGVILINQTRESLRCIEALDPDIVTISCLIREPAEMMRVFMPATIDEELRSAALSLVDAVRTEAVHQWHPRSQIA